MAKLKGATIIETVIAMTIILTIFLVAGMIFLNLNKSGVSEKKMGAVEACDIYLDQVVVEKKPDQISEVINGYQLIADIDSVTGNPALAFVYCRVYDAEKKIIAEQKRFIRINR